MTGIERLEPSSWRRLRDVRLRALADEPDAFGSSLEREQDHDEAGWRRFFEYGPWWMAVELDADVGIVAGGRNTRPEVPWVYSMWIDAAFRGRGTAISLLDEVVAWAIEQGASLLGLDVTDRVPRARAFYERYGFVASGDVVPLHRDPSIGLSEMFLDLNALDSRRQ